MALDRRNYRQLVDTTVEIANKVVLLFSSATTAIASATTNTTATSTITIRHYNHLKKKNTQQINAGSYVLQMFPSFRWVWMVDVEIGCFLCKLFWLFGNQKGRRVAGNCSSLLQLIWAQNEGVMVTRINWTNVLSLPDQPSYQNKGFWQS